MRIFIHKTAIVDDGALIGAGTKIWHWTHVCGGAQIGENVTLGQNVFIGERAVVGKNCKIQNNVSVYNDVILADGVFCGPSMVFTNVINPRATIEKKTEFQKTIVKHGVTFGANCTIICGVRISEFAMIAAGAVITKDVLPFALMAGVPARHIGWVSQHGCTLDLPLSGNARAQCPETGELYILNGNKLVVGK